MTKYPRIAVRAIIQDEDGKILILKRANTDYCKGFWNLPGGKIEYGEKVEEALKLEIFEETGLEITESSFFLYHDGIPQDKTLPHFITLIFICKAIGIVKLDNESSDYKWIGREDVGKSKIAFGGDNIIWEFWNI